MYVIFYILLLKLVNSVLLGGYNKPNTARYWTYLTSIALDKTLSNDIPNDCEVLWYCFKYSVLTMYFLVLTQFDVLF